MNKLSDNNRCILVGALQENLFQTSFRRINETSPLYKVIAFRKQVFNKSRNIIIINFLTKRRNKFHFLILSIQTVFLSPIGISNLL